MSDVASRIPVRDLRAQRVALSDSKEARALTVKRERLERRERHAGYAVYWMYLMSPFSAGITALVGLLMAAGKGRDASEVPASHFRFQVRTFWTSFLAALTGGAWAAVGGIASVANGDGGGGALVLAGAALASVSAVGFFGASLYGLTQLASRVPMGRLTDR